MGTRASFSQRCGARQNERGVASISFPECIAAIELQFGRWPRFGRALYFNWETNLTGKTLRFHRPGG